MAPRLPLRPWGRLARGAWLAVGVVAGGVGGTAVAEVCGCTAIADARFETPTDRYPHGALGDPFEWGALVIEPRQVNDLCTADCPGPVRIVLPESRVFEDTAPRIVTPDRSSEAVMVVESDVRLGARLALYHADGSVTATPFIGTPNRWLAPVGAADLDGDGLLEIAYVDRPHLAKVLRVWRLVAGELVPVASAEGHTNHRFGAPEIGGGLRACGAGPEMVTASGDWRRVLATRLVGGALVSRDIGPWTGSFDAAMACR